MDTIIPTHEVIENWALSLEYPTNVTARWADKAFFSQLIGKEPRVADRDVLEERDLCFLDFKSGEGLVMVKRPEVFLGFYHPQQAAFRSEYRKTGRTVPFTGKPLFIASPRGRELGMHGQSVNGIERLLSLWVVQTFDCEGTLNYFHQEAGAISESLIEDAEIQEPESDFAGPVRFAVDGYEIRIEANLNVLTATFHTDPDPESPGVLIFAFVAKECLGAKLERLYFER